MKVLRSPALALALSMLAAGPSVSAAEEAAALIPACAMSGARSVFIGGAPALRLSDVVNCPPELYEIVPSIMIEGQPMVKFRSGAGGKGNCAARGEGDGDGRGRIGKPARGCDLHAEVNVRGICPSP